MSDEYWTDEEMESMYKENFNPEKLFKLVNINLERGTIQHVHLKDNEDDEIEISDVVQQLINYIDKQAADENDNQFKDNIMPLITQASVSCIARLVPIELSTALLGIPIIRHTILRSMSLSFLLVKFIQKNNIKITVSEESVSEEEIDEIKQRSYQSEDSMLGLLDKPLNINSSLRKLYKDGHISKEELMDIINSD